MAYRQTSAVEARLKDNRSRILESARTLVSEGGWKDTQIASVAAAAGMATGTVYRYFASKAELFVEILSAVSQREVDVMTDISKQPGTAEGNLRKAIAAFVSRAMRNPRLAYALIAEPCDKEIDEARLKYRAAISEVIRSILKRGQETGEMRSDVQANIAASVIVGGFMEALIGPLSPLNYQKSKGFEQAEIVALSEQIARITCEGVSIRSRHETYDLNEDQQS